MLLWGFVLGQGLHRGSTWYHWGLRRPRHDPLVNKCLIKNEGVKDVWPWWWSWIIVMMTYDYMIVWWFYTKMSEFFKAHVGFTPGAGLRAAPRRGFGRGSQLRRRCPCRGNSTESPHGWEIGKIGEWKEWKGSLEMTGTSLILINLRWISMKFMVDLMVFPSFRLPRGLGRGVGSQQPSQQESLRKVQSGLSGAGILIFGCLKLKHGWKGRNMTCNRFQVWHEKALFALLILSSHIKLWIDKLFSVLFPLEVMDRIAISSFIESWRHSATLQMGPELVWKGEEGSFINVLTPECLENCELS